MKYSDVTEKIIGANMKIHRDLGNGFQEAICQQAIICLEAFNLEALINKL